MKTILLADDDPAIRQMLGQVLALERYNVIFAATGRETAAKFISSLPDLVLLDLNMPDRDGWEAFHLMNSTHPTVPVIVITARPGQQERAASSGAASLLEKPLDIPILLNAIRILLEEPREKRATGLAAA